MVIFGYICLFLMGLTLGLIGAGGSILTIPILVYIFKIPATIATTYSLLIVGSSSFVATIRYRKKILFEKVALFVIPSMVGTFSARFFLIPNLPSSFGTLTLDRALILLLLTLMTLAAYFMIKDRPLYSTNKESSPLLLTAKIVLLGFSFGFVMGLIGAGGGFLIVPTLVLLMGFGMREAIPTSLFIITINSFTGFLSDQHHFLYHDWVEISSYLILPLIGMFFGIALENYVEKSKLKKSFGWFILLTAIVIASREFIL